MVLYAGCAAAHGVGRRRTVVVVIVVGGVLHDFQGAQVGYHEHFSFPADTAQKAGNAVFVLLELFGFGLGQALCWRLGRVLGCLHGCWVTKVRGMCGVQGVSKVAPERVRQLAVYLDSGVGVIGINVSYRSK